MSPAEQAYQTAREALEQANARVHALSRALRLLSELDEIEADASLETEDVAAVNLAGSAYLSVQARLADARKALPALEAAEHEAGKAWEREEDETPGGEG